MSYVQDAVVVNSDNAEQAVCEKVGQGVRGLTGHDVMPYLSCEVASCGQHMRPGDVGNDVVDRALRETKTANWCRTARSLIPLFINGDGNCLDVACAIVLWGCSLPANLLRRLIYVTLAEFGAARYLERWRRQQCASEGSGNCFQQYGDECWEQVVKYAQPHQHDSSLHYCNDSVPLLDAIQVFVLANILRRPVVILCYVSPSTSDHSHSKRPHDEDIGGIYLPLLWRPDECVRYPMVLANIDGKFIPLVGGDGTADMPSALDIVPLVTSQLEPLRVWFLLDDEERDVYSLMQCYMNVTEVNLCQAESISMVLGARLKYQQLEGTVPSSVRQTSVTAQRPDTFHCQSSLTHLPAESVTIGTTTESVTIGTTQRPASSPIDLSVTTTPCRESHCTNFASSFVYPYCYQHIDQKIVENTLTQRQPQQMMSAPPDTSLMSVGCKQSGCANMCSVFVYPYCYEHIETKISEHHRSTGQPPQEYLMSISPDDCICPGCSNRASVNTYPVCYEHLDFFSQQQQQSHPLHQMSQQPVVTTGESTELQQSRPVYDKMMMELENKTKGSAARCRSADCNNYGNSRCEGYCHECYRMLQMTRHF